MSGPIILIVEDEARLASVLADYLAQAGFAPHVLADGALALDWVRRHAPDLILMDVMLPGRDGLTLTRELRAASTVPILITTARVEEIDRLMGLELGADDYICKPYSPREVVARVRGVLRRLAPAPPAGGLQLDTAGFRLLLDGRAVQLTALEFRLFEALYRAPGRIHTRAQLMWRIYPDQRVVSDRTVDSHVKKLRRKLAELEPERELIGSVYGAGYRYEVGS